MGTLKNLSLFILHPPGFFQGPQSEPGLILMALGSCPVVTLPQLQSLACLPDTIGEQPYVSHDYGEAHSFLQTFTKRNPDPRQTQEQIPTRWPQISALVPPLHPG